MKIQDLPMETIKGFLEDDEGMRLHDLAKDASVFGPCLEIGGYCGKSTIYLGLGCKESEGVLFSIDHHKGSEEQQPGQEYFDPDIFDDVSGRVDTFGQFRRNIDMASLSDTVIPIVARSEVVARTWTTPLAMVFIDGSHSYSSVFTDYTAWSSHILPGGFLAIHDIFPDPNKGGQAPYYMYKLAAGSGMFEELAMVGTLGILRRRKPGEVPSYIKDLRDW